MDSLICAADDLSAHRERFCDRRDARCQDKDTPPVADLGPGSTDAGLGRVAIDADIALYFCDPRSLWQRGTNETSRAWPSSTFRPQHVQQPRPRLVAHELDDRPRERLALKKRTQLIGNLLTETGHWPLPQRRPDPTISPRRADAAR